MAQQIRLTTDREFEEAMERHAPLRIFKDDHIIDTNCFVVRFDEDTVVVQSGVGEFGYHSRKECEIFEIRRR